MTIRAEGHICRGPALISAIKQRGTGGKDAAGAGASRRGRHSGQAQGRVLAFSVAQPEGSRRTGQGGLPAIPLVPIITGWPYGANQARAQALSLSLRDFLEAARVRGERRAYIILAEVLPNLASLIVANFLGAALHPRARANTQQLDHLRRLLV